MAVAVALLIFFSNKGALIEMFNNSKNIWPTNVKRAEAIMTVGLANIVIMILKIGKINFSKS